MIHFLAVCLKMYEPTLNNEINLLSKQIQNQLHISQYKL